MSGTAFPFQSNLDDVRLYGRALSSNELATIVNAFNAAPTLSDVTNRTVPVNTGTGTIAFTISDVETAPQHLTISASSSDTGLVKPTAIVFGGTGTNRIVTVTPESNRLGSAVITLTLNDGTRTTTDVFTVTVTGTQQETWRFDRFGTTASAGMAADSANPDGDPWTNTQEYALGTDPLSPNTGPQLGLVSLTNGLRISFTTQQASGTGYSGLTRYYDVESSATLAATQWSGVPGLTNLVGNNGTVTVTVPFDGAKRFYRLKARLQ
jgi:hypothetical protein